MHYFIHDTTSASSERQNFPPKASYPIYLEINDLVHLTLWSKYHKKSEPCV